MRPQDTGPAARLARGLAPQKAASAGPRAAGSAASRVFPVRRFMEGLDRLLFPLPVECLACGREAPGGAPFPGGICPACLSSWRLEVPAVSLTAAPPGTGFGGPGWGERGPRPRPGGPGWGERGSWPRPGGPGWGERGSWSGPWGRVRPVGVYHGALRDLIHRFKYGGERWLGRPLGEVMADVALVTLLRPDLLVPVPLTAGRYRRRGFNQAAELARVVGRRWRVPVANALGRRGTARRQAGLGRTARWENLRGAFVPLMDLRGATITVIDDVFTTGATLANCAAALLQAGAVQVDGLVLAVVPGDSF